MNCKPGDMAVLVKAVFPENVGLIVEVIVFKGEAWGFLDNWLCKPAWPSRGEYPSGVVDYGMQESLIPDAWLRPIRPPETPVTETRDEELIV